MAYNKNELIQKIKSIELLSKEEKAALIELLRSNKKYGLVWENKPEEVEEHLRTEIPVLKEVKERAILSDNPDAPNHILIEGDNLEALVALTYTHAGMIDVIYIDPPYNTGAKNWKYNNDYVDGQDTFKHSKWISMMNRRLKIAKILLSSRGILVLTIDDYEIENITLLLNEIFGEDNRLGTCVIKNNPQGRSSVTGFQISHEYALFYGKPQSCIGRLPRNEEQLARYGEKDEKGLFEWRNFRAQYSTESRSMVYPLFVDNNGEYFRIPKLLWKEDAKEYVLQETPLSSEHIVLPIDETGRMRTWKWGLEKVNSLMDSEMGVRKDRSGKYTVYYKGRMKDMDMLPYTIWDSPLYSASTFGANILSDIVGKNKFNYPKSIYAVIDSLKVANATDNSIILDFFAGSGTTLHATMMLNAEDGGHRHCILVTNNENKICEEVTYERNKRVIQGYTTPKGVQVEGLKNNTLRYYKTDFVGREQTPKNMRALISASMELLCIKNDLYVESDYFAGKKLNKKIARYFDDGKKQMLIVLNEEAVPYIAEEISKMNYSGKMLVYVFSPGSYAFEDDFAEVLDKIELCALPSAIYNAYQKVLPKKRIDIVYEDSEEKANTEEA